MPDHPPATPPSHCGRRGLAPWLPILVIAAAWWAHGRVLENGWVLDDVSVVRENPVVERGLAGLPGAFSSSAWGGEVEPGVWRPLTIASFCLEAPLWRTETGDLEPFGFHLTNLFLHGLCAVLLLAVVWRLAPDRPGLVAGTALVFAVHPIHAGTVAAIVGRADLLALLFALLATWFWIEADRGRPALLPPAVLCFFLALLSKETVIALPLALLALDAGVGRRGLSGALRRRPMTWALLLVPVVLFLVRWPGPFVGLAEGLGSEVEGLGQVVLGLLVPLDFVRDRLAMTDGLTDRLPAAPGWILGGLVVAGALLALVAFLRARRGGPVALGLVMTVVLGFVGALASPAGAPLEARFAYVTAPGLFLVAGRLVEVLVSRRASGAGRWRRPVGVLGVVILLVALGVLAWQETRVWGDDATYHRALIERHPGRGGLFLRLSRRLRGGIEAERRRSAGLPAAAGEERDAHIARADAILGEAEAWARAAVRRAAPSDPGEATRVAAADAYRELGFVQHARARLPEALGSLREAIRVDPRVGSEGRVVGLGLADRRRIAETYVRLGQAEEMVGEVHEAADHLEAAAALLPDDLDILRAASRTLIRAQRYETTLRLLRRALDFDLDPDLHAAIQRDFEEARRAAREAADRFLREAYRAEREGDREGEALGAYEAVMRIDPTRIDAYVGAARLSGVWFGDYHRAYAILDAAERVLRDLGARASDSHRRKLRALREIIRAQEEEDRRAEEAEDGDR